MILQWGWIPYTTLEVTIPLAYTNNYAITLGPDCFNCSCSWRFKTLSTFEVYYHNGTNGPAYVGCYWFTIGY